jgi:hypothetical protein
MPSCRTSFPSLGSTTSPALYSFLLLRSRRKGSAQAWMFAVFFRRSPTYRARLVEQFGPPRFLGSPLVPLPCSRDPGRATLATVNSARWYCPRHIEHEGHDNDFSRLIHTASVPAVYASRFGFPYTGKTRFRSGDSPYRMGFEPIRLLQRISSVALSPPIPTLQA